MKKRLTRLAALLAVLLCTTVLTGYAADFSDITSHWGREAILYWVERDVVEGYPDGTFCPNGSITRAEVAKIIVSVLQLEPDDAASIPFSDVSPDFWGYSCIQACAQHGILIGYTDGTFLPNQHITRQEAMTVLYRITTFESSAPLEAVAAAPDGDTVGRWAANAVGTMLDSQIVVGYPDGSIGPKNQLTRAEFVTMMQRIDLLDSVWNQNPTGDVSGQLFWRSNDGSVTISTQTVNGKNYLFLPSSADITALKLSELPLRKTGDLGTTTDTVFDLTALSSKSDQSVYTLTLTTDGDHSVETKVYIMASQNIGTIFLTSDDPVTEGRDYVEAVKGNATTGSMVMLASDGTTIYDGTLSQIKSRGNSTFTYEKKPYQIKLNKKTDLLGNGEKVKTWVLLASYVDATMIHDKLCKDLATDLNMAGSPDCQWVDLYYDGQYRGTYLLSEKLTISSTGIDITDLEGAYEDVNENYGDNVTTVVDRNRFNNEISYVSGLTDPEDISNGYLIEMNGTAGDENCWFKSSAGYAFNIKSPENVTLAAATYVSEFYQEFEDAVYATDASGAYTGINPETGRSYDEYCDLNSLVQMYLLYVFSCNKDCFVRSTFFYLSDGILHADTCWDGDLCFGTGWEYTFSATSNVVSSRYLASALESIPSFRQAVADYYNSTFRDYALEYAQNRIYSYGEQLAASEAMNHQLWPTYYQCGLLTYAHASNYTYTRVINNMANWATARIAYMDEKFGLWS